VNEQALSIEYEIGSMGVDGIQSLMEWGFTSVIFGLDENLPAK